MTYSGEILHTRNLLQTMCDKTLADCTNLCADARYCLYFHARYAANLRIECSDHRLGVRLPGGEARQHLGMVVIHAASDFFCLSLCWRMHS
jgi:hypothetical protein